MKRKSFVAIIAAMALLSGCASQENITTGSLPAISGSSGVSSGADTEVNSGSDVTSGTSSTSVDSGTSGTSGAYSEPSVPETGVATGVSEPAADKPESKPSTTTSAKHSDPVGDEYTGKDIGGTGVSGDSYSLTEDGIFMDIAEDTAKMDIAGFAGGAADPECCPLPDPDIDPYYEPQIPPEAGLLTGGEWNDNENWDFWQGLYNSQNYQTDWENYKKDWRTGADFRLEVAVRDGAGNPVSGAKVVAGEYSAVTDNKGKAYLFYSQDKVINGFTDITVTAGDISKSDKITLGSDESIEFTLDSEVKAPEKTLDFMIMCDTTGSMWDELDYLKAELNDVVTRIKQENANIPTRLSVNFYRDEGDEYVVREFPFTTDLDAAVNAISQQSADGGGDTPEAVHTALESAINGHDWDEDSIKIMFLVLDAPPHGDIQIIDETVKLVKQAAEKGIRIIPVASSGIDKSCEYLLRSMAFMTGGTYTFLTDDSGIGGDHIEPTIGSYDVEKLNDMMVRITGEYLK